MSIKRIKQLNDIAIYDNLELVKGEGYFFWCGIGEPMETLCASLDTSSVYVPKFSMLSSDQWTEELNIIRARIKNELIEQIREIDKFEHDADYYSTNFDFKFLYKYWLDKRKIYKL